MSSKRKRPKAAKSQPEVWVSPDLMDKLKGTDGHRGVPLPQSPYLVLADRFLGFLPSESASKPPHRAAAQPAHKTREVAAPEPPPKAMAAAAAAGAGPEMLSSVPPRMSYPKPPARPQPPKPPKLAISKLPARPNLPKLHPPRPPKLSFGYRRPKVDRSE